MAVQFAGLLVQWDPSVHPTVPVSTRNDGADEHAAKDEEVFPHYYPAVHGGLTHRMVASTVVLTKGSHGRFSWD